MIGAFKNPNRPDKDFIRIGSRESPLAVIQVQEVVDLLGAHGICLGYRLKTFKTAGDKDKTTPFSVLDGGYPNHDGGYVRHDDHGRGYGHDQAVCDHDDTGKHFFLTNET
jgi:hypothetical protein